MKLLTVKILPVALWSGDFNHENASRNLAVVWDIIQLGTCTVNCTIKKQIRGFFLHPMRGEHRIKSTNDREGSRYKNYDAASGTIFRISKFFKEANRKFIYIFLLNKASGYKLKKHLRMYRKYWFNFIGFQKNIYLVTQNYKQTNKQIQFFFFHPSLIYDYNLT